MGFLSKLFKKTENNVNKKDYDSPLDYREDGSIHEGDPMWDLFESAMENGSASAYTFQKEDGSWEIEEMNPEDDENFYNDAARYVEFDEEDYER